MRNESIFEIIFEYLFSISFVYEYSRRDLLRSLFPNRSSRRADRNSTCSNNVVIIFIFILLYVFNNNIN